MPQKPHAKLIKSKLACILVFLTVIISKIVNTNDVESNLLQNHKTYLQKAKYFYTPVTSKKYRNLYSTDS